MKVVHLITDLDVGGAEMTLARLVARFDRTRIQSSVIVLSGPSALSKRLAEQGIPVETLSMSGGLGSLSALWRLRCLIRRVKPTIVQTWLYHADLAGLVTGMASGISRSSICWNVRCAELDPRDHAGSTMLVRRLLAWLSPLPACVVVNSMAGQRAHSEIGYRPRRWEFIPNGIDLEAFAPSGAKRASTRAALGVSEQTPLVGIMARWHPMKDHATFVRAAAKVAAEKPDARFVMAGRGVDRENRDLMHLIEAHGLTGSTILSGEVADSAAWFAAMDVAVSSSYSEAFPNVVAEAMACGLPCVATDAGDSALVLGDAGALVPVRDPDALGQAVVDLLSLDPEKRRYRGLRARARVDAEYSIARAVERYERMYVELSGAR